MWCAHSTTITTITAGLAREVCESCGRVRLSYVEPSVQIYPTPPRRLLPPLNQAKVAGTRRSCMLCSQLAIYLIPGKIVCDEHAWQAAAMADWDDAELWVPIRIDKSNAWD